MPDIHILFGEPKAILGSYSELAGKPALPPEWAFGLWVSANRWNCQRHIAEQLEEIKALHYPATVLVIEAWSDEATFYIWNDAQYGAKGGAAHFEAGDFRYPSDGRWPDPEAMIRELHDNGIKLILWQIPVLKKQGQLEPVNRQHERDIAHAVADGLCVGDGAGGVYVIPHFWFSGGLLPDFTNPRASQWWFSKRRYLLDMGVDGFKTDGGEFIHDDACAFHNGDTGIEMKNGFAASYLNAYGTFAGPGRTLFSRVGYAGSQRSPIHWAGDQESTWQELRSVLRAGLSLGLSGVPFWSFDIGGFAGPLPSAELYIRSTQLAAFVPVMQWHSEPMGGQYAGTPGEEVNDRSPWNIARLTEDPDILKLSVYYANLRRSLLPYLYSEAQKSALSGLPMMRALALEYPDDPRMVSVWDQFMLGDLLIAPVVEEGARARTVYLPKGQWKDLWTGEDLVGETDIVADTPLDHIPVYLRLDGPSKSVCDTTELAGLFEVLRCRP